MSKMRMRQVIFIGYEMVHFMAINIILVNNFKTDDKCIKKYWDRVEVNIYVINKCELPLQLFMKTLFVGRGYL